jgi:hypothetical protein
VIKREPSKRSRASRLHAAAHRGRTHVRVDKRWLARRPAAGCCDRRLVVEPGGQGSLQARGVSGDPAACSRRSRGRDAGHAPLRRALMAKCIAGHASIWSRRRAAGQYHSAFDDRARPSISGDPGRGIRQPNDTSRGAKAPGAPRRAGSASHSNVPARMRAGSCRGLRAGAEIVVIHKLPGTEIGLQRGAG